MPDEPPDHIAQQRSYQIAFAKIQWAVLREPDEAISAAHYLFILVAAIEHGQLASEAVDLLKRVAADPELRAFYEAGECDECARELFAHCLHRLLAREGSTSSPLALG